MLRFEDHEGVEPILPFKTPYSKVEDLDVTEEQVERVRELYAAELTYIDAWIGRLLNELDDLGLDGVDASSTTSRTTASCSASTA